VRLFERSRELGEVAALGLCLALAACSQSSDQRSSPRPTPAPQVVLSAEDRERWAPGPPTRDKVPVLLYHGVPRDALARQLTLLHEAGYETITLDQLVRFVERKRVSLPPRPVLLTFDGGRIATWLETDGVLDELGFGAVLFVNVGRIEDQDRSYLGWDQLSGLQRSGRWDVQLQSGTAGDKIRYGPRPDDVGPFYAYRGAEEVLGGWRERVFSDITYGEEQLAHHLERYRPLAFAPPDGNFGQAGTNDPRIPRELLARLLLSFEVVFTQDRTGLARPGARNPLGRIEVTPAVTEAALRRLLLPAPT
jgi:peptidoglycan/xylan/chitin deacetylase (PgdA/CDA1 family)